MVFYGPIFRRNLFQYAILCVIKLRDNNMPYYTVHIYTRMYVTVCHGTSYIITIICIKWLWRTEVEGKGSRTAASYKKSACHVHLVL